MTLDLVLFCLFLALNVIVGLWYSGNITTLRQYAVGEKKFTTATSIATLVATALGGEVLLFQPSNVYRDGLLAIIPLLLGKFIAFWFTAQVVTVRMGKLFQSLSVAEAMGTLYGRAVRVLTAVCGIPSMVVTITLQFYFIAQIVGLIFGLAGAWMMPITVCLVIVYSAFGSIYAVTFTDVLQFMVICIIMPLLILVLYHTCQDPSPIITALTTHPEGSWQHIKDGGPACRHLLSTLLAFSVPTQLASPAFFQRIVMTSSIYQAKKTFTYATLFYCLLQASALVLGLLLVAHNPALRSKAVMPYLIATFSMYPAFKGLLAIAVVSMAMSTADSLLNTSAVLFVNDIIKPFQQVEDTPQQHRRTLAIAKVWSLGVGAGALLLAYYYTHYTWNISAIARVNYTAFQLIRSTYFVPLLCTIFGFYSTPQAVLSSMIAGGSTAVLVRMYILRHGEWCLLFGTLANSIVLFVVHYRTANPQDKTVGWVGISPTVRSWVTQLGSWRLGLQQVKSFRLYAYCKGLLPRQAWAYPGFAGYILLVIYLPLVTWGCCRESYPLLYTVLTASILLFVAVLLSYPLWPPSFRWQPGLVFLWLVGIGYFLFGISTTLLLVEGFHRILGMAWIIQVVLVGLLLPWPVVGSLVVLGGIGAFLLLTSLTDWPGFACIPLTGQAFYGALLLLCLALILYKHQVKRQRLQEIISYQRSLLQSKAKEQLHTLQYQAFLKKSLRVPSESFQFVRKALVRLSAQSSAENQAIEQALMQCDAYIRDQINSFDHMMNYVVLHVARISVAELLAQLATLLRSFDLHLVVRVTTLQTHLCCDATQVVQLLLNSIRSLLAQLGPSERITLSLQDTLLVDPCPELAGRGPLQLPAIGFLLTVGQADAFSVGPSYTRTPPPAERSVPHQLADFLQQQNERMLDAHGGYAAVQAPSRLLYVLPVGG